MAGGSLPTTWREAASPQLGRGDYGVLPGGGPGVGASPSSGPPSPQGPCARQKGDRGAGGAGSDQDQPRPRGDAHPLLGRPHRQGIPAPGHQLVVQQEIGV